MQVQVTWLEVWEYAVQDIQITTVLRLLMDDSHLPVMTAAAEALAVLVGPGPEEEELWAAADHTPKCDECLVFSFFFLLIVPLLGLLSCALKQIGKAQSMGALCVCVCVCNTTPLTTELLVNSPH